MDVNKKRAHDLAIASIPILFEMKKINVLNATNKNTDVVFDVYSEYLEAYLKLLKSFNRDFPLND